MEKAGSKLKGKSMGIQLWTEDQFLQKVEVAVKTRELMAKLKKIEFREHMILLTDYRKMVRITGLMLGVIWLAYYDDLVGSTKDRYISCGRCGSGKSSFVTQIFFNLLTHNQDMVGLFSMDLSYLDLVARLYAVFKANA